jgi:signal transduction histidine kinase
VGIRSTRPLSADPIAATDSSGVADAVVPGPRFSLYAKSVVAFAMLVAYLTIVGLYVAHEQGRMFYAHVQMDQLHHKNTLLINVNAALTYSIVMLQEVLNAESVDGRIDDVRLDLAALAPGLPKVKETFPETAPGINRLERHMSELRTGQDRSRLIALRNVEQQVAAELEKIEIRIQGQLGQLAGEDLALIRGFAAIVLGAFLTGVVIFGSALTVFFSRLASDIKRAEARALELIKGYRGNPLVVARRDEVGSLMQTLNRMQLELYRGEQQREISRQHRFHQEKMAAVGSLAAAVAHEINNPINSISGIAQHTIDSIQSRKRPDDQALCDSAEFILKQTERIALIVRQIADLTAPRSADPELLNINELVQSTCSFIRFDKRFRHVKIIPELDFDLPAVRAVADHLTQVLMNLLINAADAVQEVEGRAPTIRVTTHRTDGTIMLSVSDNGHGMDPAVLAHVFEQSFTTKPAGKGRGIGLYLCKTLIEEANGRIELASTQSVGTTVRVSLPSQHG